MNAPPIHYATTPDGVRIAYCAQGSGVPAVLLKPRTATHLQREWEVPGFQRWYRGLAAQLHFIRYAPRGLGLSGPAADFSRDAYLADVTAVLDALRLPRTALISVLGDATDRALAFAAAFPHRVAAVVVLQYIELDTRPRIARTVERVSAVAPELRHAFADPDGRSDNAAMLRFDEVTRQPLPVGAWDGDATDAYASVEAPVLVVQYPERTFTGGAELASQLRNAQLATRSGSGAPPWDPDLDGLIGLLTGFITEHTSTPADFARGRVPPNVLTPREREVMGLLAEGLANDAIAERLGISGATATRHVSNILRKLDLDRRAQLVRYALEHGLTG